MPMGCTPGEYLECPVPPVHLTYPPVRVQIKEHPGVVPPKYVHVCSVNKVKFDMVLSAAFVDGYGHTYIRWLHSQQTLNVQVSPVVRCHLNVVIKTVVIVVVVQVGCDHGVILCPGGTPTVTTDYHP